MARADRCTALHWGGGQPACIVPGVALDRARRLGARPARRSAVPTDGRLARLVGRHPSGGISAGGLVERAAMARATAHSTDCWIPGARRSPRRQSAVWHPAGLAPHRARRVGTRPAHGAVDQTHGGPCHLAGRESGAWVSAACQMDANSGRVGPGSPCSPATQTCGSRAGMVGRCAIVRGIEDYACAAPVDVGTTYLASTCAHRARTTAPVCRGRQSAVRDTPRVVLDCAWCMGTGTASGAGGPAIHRGRLLAERFALSGLSTRCPMAHDPWAVGTRSADGAGGPVATHLHRRRRAARGSTADRSGRRAGVSLGGRPERGWLRRTDRRARLGTPLRVPRRSGG